jgi:hypothetical protein
LAEYRADLDPTVVGSHDSVDRSEPEAAPRELRREERIEHFRDRRLVHPAAGVAHFERNVATGLHVARRGEHRRASDVDIFDPRRHVDGAEVIADRFGAVDDEVHHDLLNLRGIGLDRGEARAKIEMQPDLLRQGRLDEARELGDVLREIRRHDLKPPFARIREELSREVRRTPGSFDAVTEHRLHGVRRIEHKRGCRDRPLNRREHVVEVVRDPTGEQTEALELLYVEQPRAEDALLVLRATSDDEIRDVERVHENAVHRAVHVAERHVVHAEVSRPRYRPEADDR